MAGQRFPLDRSAMFTVLLDVDPAFPRMESGKGTERVTEALNAWYGSPSVNMYAFGKEWAKAHPAG